MSRKNRTIYYFQKKKVLCIVCLNHQPKMLWSNHPFPTARDDSHDYSSNELLRGWIFVSQWAMVMMRFVRWSWWSYDWDKLIKTKDQFLATNPSTTPLILHIPFLNHQFSKASHHFNPSARPEQSRWPHVGAWSHAPATEKGRLWIQRVNPWPQKQHEKPSPKINGAIFWWTPIWMCFLTLEKDQGMIKSQLSGSRLCALLSKLLTLNILLGACLE